MSSLGNTGRVTLLVDITRAEAGGFAELNLLFNGELLNSPALRVRTANLPPMLHRMHPDEIRIDAGTCDRSVIETFKNWSNAEIRFEGARP